MFQSAARRALLLPLMLAMAGTLVLAVPSSASAARLTVTDARDDVHKLNLTNTRPQRFYLPAPEETGFDVLRTMFLHAPKRVIVRTVFVDLRREGALSGYLVRMRTSAGNRFAVDVTTTRRNPGGRAILTHYVDGRRIDCTVKRRVNYRADTVTLSFPRACIGNPRSVQFTAKAYHSVSGEVFVDNPHTTRAEPRVWTRRVLRG